MSELRRIWRIATRGPSWAADDLSGGASARSAGRWNSPGVPVVHASTTIALACLETMVHVAGLPVRRWLVAIDVPEVHWQERTELAPEDLPGWDARPSGAASSAWGDRWLVSQSTLLAAVPSVIVPEERNVLIHPAHPASSSLVAHVVRPWSDNNRLLLRPRADRDR